jgi:hypothetical protein
MAMTRRNRRNGATRKNGNTLGGYNVNNSYKGGKRRRGGNTLGGYNVNDSYKGGKRRRSRKVGRKH